MENYMVKLFEEVFYLIKEFLLLLLLFEKSSFVWKGNQWLICSSLFRL